MMHLHSLALVFLTFTGFSLMLIRSKFPVPLFRKSHHGLVPYFLLPLLLVPRCLLCTLRRRINDCPLVTMKFLLLIERNILLWYVPSLLLFKLPTWKQSLTLLHRLCSCPIPLPQILYSTPQLAHTIWTMTSSKTLFYYATM